MYKAFMTGMFGVFLVTIANAADANKSGKFSSAASCGTCHEDIYRQWQTSPHSRAATDPIFWEFFKQASRDVNKLAAGACLSCHAPIASVTKEVKMTEPVAFPVNLTALAKEGVTCDFCHSIAGGEYAGKDISVGIYRYAHKGDTSVKYGTHADASTPEHKTEVSTFLKSSEFCGICHKFTHPVSNTVWQDTYAEWKNGPYAKEGRACQDCHMPSYAGRGATDGPTRSDLSAHFFPGGYSDMVQKAAIVSVSGGMKTKSGKKSLVVKAQVTNVGSGHLLPTGIPGIRQMWLEVKVLNSKKEEVLMQKTEYTVQILDGAGKPAMPWNAVELGKDTRIAPRKSRETALEMPIAGMSDEAFEVGAVVYYRQISESAAKAAGIQETPAIAIAKDGIRVFPNGKVEKLSVVSAR